MRSIAQRSAADERLAVRRRLSNRHNRSRCARLYSTARNGGRAARGGLQRSQRYTRYASPPRVGRSIRTAAVAARGSECVCVYMLLPYYFVVREIWTAGSRLLH